MSLKQNQYTCTNKFNASTQGRRGWGARGSWPTLEFRLSDFSEIVRFRRKITDFALALSTFDQFRIFASLSVLPTMPAVFVAIR